MSEKNRWMIAVTAILIQLALGAIYAWSVFTPGLTLPLEQENFTNDDVVVIGGTEYTISLAGDLDDPVAGSDTQTAAFSIANGGTPYPGTLNITIRSFITDVDGEPVDRVVVKGKTLYTENDIDGKYTYTFQYNGSPTEFEFELPSAGNWHFTIVVDEADAGDREADILINDGLVGDFGFTGAQTQIIFSAGLATFAVMTIVAGKLVMPNIGPRFTAVLGGVLLGAGYVGAGVVGQTFINQFLLIGIVGGAGIGLGYVVPIAVCIKWYPDKKGLITGIGVAGFGFGALMWVQLGNGFLGTLIADMGTLAVFQLYGIMFLILVVASSMLMVNPPEGYNPKGWKPPVAKKAEACDTGANEFESGEMLKTRQFWTIWTLFVFGALAGLMVIGNIALFGIDALQDSGYEKAESAKIAATAMGLFAITNGLGRIAWGAFSDKLGRQRSIVLMSLTQGVFMMVFLGAGSNPWTFTIAAMAIGFNFGGNFTLFPTLTADYFGNKSVGRNYGFVFSSYGVGGIVGPILGGYASTSEAGFALAFIPAGILCLIGAFLAFTLSPPKLPKRLMGKCDEVDDDDEDDEDGAEDDDEDKNSDRDDDDREDEEDGDRNNN